MPSGPVEGLQVRQRLEALEENLSPYASRSSQSLGRELPETPSPLRTESVSYTHLTLPTKA